MAGRDRIRDFELANALYAGATVTFYLANSNGARTDTKASLYSAQTGTGALPNPQTLDGKGKLKQPTYFADRVIAVIEGTAFPSHETGVLDPVLSESADAAINASQAQAAAVMAAQSAREAARTTAAARDDEQIALIAQSFG